LASFLQSNKNFTLEINQQDRQSQLTFPLVRSILWNATFITLDSKNNFCVYDPVREQETGSGGEDKCCEILSGFM
jgi:hypothetical protein